MTTLLAISNQSKRTFTIRKIVDGILVSKFRTYEMNEDEFEENEMNTENDWKNFLKSDNYFECK